MGKDLPDGTRKMVLEFLGGLVGLEELAIRLGSMVPFDMQGNVFFTEGFEVDLSNWETLTNGVGSSATIATDSWWGGKQALALVAASSAGAYAADLCRFPYLGSKRYGFACRVTIPVTADDTRYLITFKHNTTITYSGVAIDHVNKVVKVRTGAATYQTVLTLPKATDDYATYHSLQYYVDLTTGYYVKLIFDDTEVDLSAYALGTATDATAEDYIEAEVGNYADAGIGSTILFDDLVGVRNVP